MTYLQAAILGIVEGLTEFLPISSTGHLMIAGELMHLEDDSFHKTFDIAIQSGAILAVVFLYWRALLVDRQILLRVIVAFVPTGILGFLLYKTVTEVFLKSIPLVLWSFALGGAVLIGFERDHGERRGAREGMQNLTFLQAVGIGLFQALAMVPGVSRSAATVVGGLTLGVTRRTSVEFSFLLAVPTMLAATGYSLYKKGSEFSADHWNLLLIGFGVSFVVAVLAVQFMLQYIKKHTFIPFGYYRIAAALFFGYWLYWR
jgi:undecaprenyl-diphosphatase